MFAKLSWKMFSTHDFWFSGKLKINADLLGNTLGASQRKGLFWKFMFLYLCLHESINFYQVWLFLIDYRTFEYPKIRSIYLWKPPCSQSSLQRFGDAMLGCPCRMLLNLRLTNETHPPKRLFKRASKKSKAIGRGAGGVSFDEYHQHRGAVFRGMNHELRACIASRQMGSRNKEL